MTNPQQKTQFKNQLHEIHEEISERTQKQSQAFAEQSPKIKKSEVTNNLRIRR
ncbi:LtrC-like protein [Levilactobacillus namurensis]|nr:LtrC-like protein [Levilactobacillus namurensis]